MTWKRIKVFLTRRAAYFPVDGTNLASKTRTRKQHEGCQRRRWVTLLAPHVCIRRRLNVHSGRRSPKENSSALSYSLSIAENFTFREIQLRGQFLKVTSKVESGYRNRFIFIWYEITRRFSQYLFSSAKTEPMNFERMNTFDWLYSTVIGQEKFSKGSLGKNLHKSSFQLIYSHRAITWF